ncbi:MAG: N-acetylmuramoyl-L-alanine amidase [Bryobacterales bacterium]|nr:N-acetylmuramoyl-L-alanine amidase [Bryobacterales bacterium]
MEKNRFRLDSSRYLPQRHSKDLIVLHFTAGTSCESAYRTWQADPQRIGTAFGVDPDGTIIEFFPPDAWAYHLGIKGTRVHDQRSIGIEIANVGPLRPDPADPNQLNWWPRNWGMRYCHRHHQDRYVSRDYRGMSAFASMPQAQMEATGLLVRHLCDQFGIPKVACREARLGEYNPGDFAHYKGVASHSNFRQDKWDVGPAFDWDCLGF